MSRIKSSKISSIVLGLLREFASVQGDAVAEHALTFTYEGETFVSRGVDACMDNAFDRFPVATAERIASAINAASELTHDERARQRAAFAARDAIVDAPDARRTRVMNARLPLAYCHGEGVGRIMRRCHDGREWYQFSGHDFKGELVEVIDSDGLFTLREIVASRMPHAPRCVA